VKRKKSIGIITLIIIAIAIFFWIKQLIISESSNGKETKVKQKVNTPSIKDEEAFQAAMKNNIHQILSKKDLSDLISKMNGQGIKDCANKIIIYCSKNNIDITSKFQILKKNILTTGQVAEY